MQSRLLAFVMIHIMYGGKPITFGLDRPDGTPPADWYDPSADTVRTDQNPAFAHNLTALIDEILKDGARVLLVPYRLADNYSVPEEVYVRANEQTLKQIAEDRQLPVAPFPASVISAANWVDGSHLNSDGCRQKAEHIAAYAKNELWPQP